MKTGPDVVHDLIAALTDPIITWDRDGVITGWNPAAVGLFGVSEPDMLGRPLASLPGISRGDLASIVDATVDGGQTLHDIEITLDRADSELMNISISAAPLHDEDGDICGGVATVRDVTDRRRELNALRDAEERYRTLIDHSPAVTYTEDIRTGIVNASPQILPLTGFTQEELASRQDFWFDFIHPDDLERVGEAMAVADATHQPYAVDVRVFRRDGRLMWLHNRGVMHRDSDGNPRYWQGFLLDNTDRILAEQERAKLAEMLEAVFVASPLAIIVTDADGRVMMWNPTAERLFGWTQDELIGEYAPIIPEGDPDTLESRMAELRRGEHRFSFEAVRQHKDGTLIDVSISSAPIRDAQGEITGSMAMYLDIRETKRASALLREAEHTLRTLVEQSPSVLYRTGAVNTTEVLYMSPQIATLTGRSVEEVANAGKQWYDIGIHPDDAALLRRAHIESRATGQSFKIEYRIVRPDGSTIWVQDECQLIRDATGEPVYWQGLIIDISHRKELEAELRHQAFHDALTGLPNRSLLLDRCSWAMATARRVGSPPAILFLDLDNFKIINDSLGHNQGDAVLIAVAERLTNVLRDVDTISRFGGDEFAILLNNVDDIVDAIAVAERVRVALEQPIVHGHRQVTVTTSIGIALADESVETPDDLLRRSDIAMYRAKLDGRNRIAVFDAALHEAALRRLELETGLRRAVRDQQFVVHYQPKVQLATGNITGFEALVRWNHPEEGLVSPGEFIPIAEESGLIVPIGRWVLEEACRQVESWNRGLPKDRQLTMSVNLSARQFQQPDLVHSIEQMLITSGLDPVRLTLEITETAVMEDIDVAIERLNALRSLGVKIAIDDFGTGYSSLSYLTRFPVDVLKVDRSFVSGLGMTTADTAIVSASITLAHALGLTIVAEGVETALQRDMLENLGCDRAQGYFFSKPVPASHATLLLSQAERWESGIAT